MNNLHGIAGPTESLWLPGSAAVKISNTRQHGQSMPREDDVKGQPNGEDCEDEYGDDSLHGTPNDVRLFPSSSTTSSHSDGAAAFAALASRRATSERIPIASNAADRSAAEQQRHRDDAVLAEYRETVMYRRIRDFQKQQQHRASRRASAGHGHGGNGSSNATSSSSKRWASSSASSSSAPTPTRLQPRLEPESLVSLLQVHAQHFHYGGGASSQLYLPPLQPQDIRLHRGTAADDDNHDDNDDTGMDDEEDEGIFELDL